MSFCLRYRSYPVALLALLVAGCSGPATPPAPDTGLASIVPQPAGLNGFFDCLEEAGVTLVAAHRGGAIENSITGMTETLKNGPAIMEIDVNRSADGVLFLLHDDTLDRTTTGEGPAVSYPWSYIQTLQVEGPDGTAYPEAPPKFDEVLAWSKGRTMFEIDIKSSVRYEDVVDTIRAAGATDRIVYIAYSVGQARRLHELHPEAMISVTIDSPGGLADAVAAGIPADRILAWTGITEPRPDLFDAMNYADVEVLFGTLGGADSIDNRIAASGAEDYYADLARDGVDLIATDRPAQALAAMKKAGLPVAAPACGVFGAG